MKTWISGFTLGFIVFELTMLSAQPQEPVDMVEPLLDSSNSRWFYFSSASRPFGMVNLSPDMELEGAWGSGYRYKSDTVRTFSHIHAWQLSGIPVLPTTGTFRGHLGPDNYGSSYSHDTEEIQPGYHKITLNDYDITVELTSTTRVGFHRYTFPESNSSSILFDFSTILGPSDTRKGYVKKMSETELAGYALMDATIRRPKPTYVYFTAVFDKPFDFFGGWKDGRLIPIDDVIDGKKTGAYVQFDTDENEQRLMKVGISYVSIDQARLNLNTELPHWDFDKVIKDARNEWNKWLGRIEIEGGNETQRNRFYTDLWKALQGRRILSDVDGKYSDMTGEKRKIGQIPRDDEDNPPIYFYNFDSLWGTLWNLNILWSLLYPEVSESFINSMLLMYDDGGMITHGPSGGNYTYVMVGAPATPFITSAYMKSIRGFNIEKAYEGMRKNHFPRGMMSKAGYEHTTNCGGGIDSYIEKGYVPYPLNEDPCGAHEDGSGQTLTYAYEDWALSQMAASLGYSGDYGMFTDRAHNYENIWQDDYDWMWIRDDQGNWKEPYDLLAYDDGWIESNAAQSTWAVPHDINGLITLMDGPKEFTTKLNYSFEEAETHDFTSGSSHEEETIKDLRRVYINYGNQLSMHTAWLFNYSGAPWLTQYWSRKIVDNVFSGISPEQGYNGDEDQGQMGSLAVLFKTGIFSTRGGAALKLCMK